MNHSLIAQSAIRSVMAFRPLPRPRALFGKRPPPERIYEIVEAIRAELEHQNDVAVDRLQQPFFTDGRTGRNTGRDELLALIYLRRIDLEPTDEERIRPAIYLHRVLDRVRTTKLGFAKQEDDPEGFGAGTFSEIIRKLEDMQSDAG